MYILDIQTVEEGPARAAGGRPAARPPVAELLSAATVGKYLNYPPSSLVPGPGQLTTVIGRDKHATVSDTDTLTNIGSGNQNLKTSYNTVF